MTALVVLVGFTLLVAFTFYVNERALGPRPEVEKKQPRPTFAQIMEQSGLDTLNLPTLCFALSWLMFVCLIGWGIYRVINPH